MSLRSRSSFKAGILAVLAFVCSPSLPFGTATFAQNSRIEFVSEDNDVFQFRVTNVTDDFVTLEGSLNLEDWFSLQASAPENGTAHFAFTNDASASTWYFRGALNPPPGPGLILAQEDTNLTTSILLTPDTGGTITLQDRAGITYEFTASSNLVAEPVAIRMTVITNFTEFPEHDGLRSAVNFAPDGFSFNGQAQLRIIFPTNIPPAEMAAYSFDNDGTGFHLLPSRPGTNEVVFGISYFSGKGVARFSNSRVPTFDRAWNGAKSAIIAAQHRAALRERAALRAHYVDEVITEQQLDQRFKDSDLQKLEDIYRGAVKPFERAGANDCAIGQAVVMGELERLARLWAQLTGRTRRESPYFPKLVAFAPKVRCACSHRLIERCEKEPNVSGSTLLRGLDNVLFDAQLYTQRTDAQGCDLGSDEQIRDRLASGPCFGAWAGTITMTRIQSRKGTVSYSLAGLPVTDTYDNEIREIFRGEIAAITEQVIFINNDGLLEEFWDLKLTGPSSVGYRELEKREMDFGDMIQINTDSASASIVQAGEGNTTLRLIDGKFEALGPGGGVPNTRNKFDILNRSLTSWICKTPRPPNNPCPSSTESKNVSRYSIFQGHFVGNDDPNATVTVTPKDISLHWKRTREVEMLPGPPQVTVDEITVTFRRAPPR